MGTTKKTIDYVDDRNWIEIKTEFERHKGELVIIPYGRQIARFIGICVDDEDYYYIFFDGESPTICSCVTGFIPLKGKLDESDYNHLKRGHTLNSRDTKRNGIGCEELEKEILDFLGSAKCEVPMGLHVEPC